MWVTAAAAAAAAESAKDYQWHNEAWETALVSDGTPETPTSNCGFIRNQLRDLPLLCSRHSRHPGILPPSAQRHHRVRRTEDRCLPELKGGGERHPLLPAHWTGAGKTFAAVPSPHRHCCGWATCKSHLFAFQLDAKSRQSWQCRRRHLLQKLCAPQIKAT